VRRTGVVLVRTLIGASACILGGVGPAIADQERPWELQVGTGIAYQPDYSGSRSSGPRLRLWVDGKYRTNDFGSFTLDSGSLTIDPDARWDLIDKPDLGAGVLLGYRFGRNSSNPGLTATSDGSARLAGLAEVRGTFDAGVAGHVTVFGVPLFAQLRSALSGSQGTLVNLGVFVPIVPASNLELVMLPTVTWANARQTRAFYGVTEAESGASGFAAYTPSAGWENAALEIASDWSVGGGLHLVASFAFQRLLNGAAASPIVQTRNQTSALAGVAWSF
jgi:outer membrane protein